MCIISMQRMQKPTKTRKEFIEDNRKLLALIVTLAERFVYDLQEVANRTGTIESMRERYGGWNVDVRRRYIRLTDEDIAPDDLHDWSEAIMDLAGWVADMSVLLENERGDGAIGENEKWLIKNAITRYHESIDRLKKIEDEMEW